MARFLHGSARTTPRVRAELQASKEKTSTLARLYGLSRTTVAKWRSRSGTSDAPMGPRERRSTVLTSVEEVMIVAFRQLSFYCPKKRARMVKPSLNSAAQAEADDYKYLSDYVHPIPGWLEDYAAIRTMGLLTWQEQNGVGGPLFEIGVYLGRHLALMLRSALRTGDAVVGLDTFQFAPLDTVKGGLTQIADPDSIVWLQTFSTSCSSRQILQVLGGEPRFISVDGSHESVDVIWDLGLAEEMLAPRGIVSVDDFLNPITLGVNEGVHKFFAMPRNLAPIAYTANKLFLCRPGQAADYMQVFENAIMADQIEPRSATFRERSAQARHLVEQHLWGKPLLIAA